MNATRETRTVLVIDTTTAKTWQVVTTIVCTAERHGTLSAYKNAGCRCPGASDKAAAYEKKRRTGRILAEVDATGTIRRLQALAVAGWSSTDLSPLIGRHSVSLSQVRRGAFRTVTGATAKAVREVYDELDGREGPSRRARLYAQRYGYEPSEAWTPDTIDDPAAQPWQWDVLRDDRDLDERAIERAITGERVPLTRTERIAAVHRLAAAGLTPTQIADRLHMSGARVHQILGERGAA